MENILGPDTRKTPGGGHERKRTMLDDEPYLDFFSEDEDYSHAPSHVVKRMSCIDEVKDEYQRKGDAEDNGR